MTQGYRNLVTNLSAVKNMQVMPISGAGGERENPAAAAAANNTSNNGIGSCQLSDFTREDAVLTNVTRLQGIGSREKLYKCKVIMVIG